MTTIIRGTTRTWYRDKAMYTFLWRLDAGWAYKGKVWGVPLGYRPKIYTNGSGNHCVKAVPVDDSSSEED